MVASRVTSRHHTKLKRHIKFNVINSGNKNFILKKTKKLLIKVKANRLFKIGQGLTDTI